MAYLEFPLNFKRQFADSLDADYRMNTAQREAYLASPLRYAGQIVFDTEEGKPYYLKADKTAWLPFGGGETIIGTKGVTTTVPQPNARLIYDLASDKWVAEQQSVTDDEELFLLPFKYEGKMAYVNYDPALDYSGVWLQLLPLSLCTVKGEGDIDLPADLTNWGHRLDHWSVMGSGGSDGSGTGSTLNRIHSAEYSDAYN